MGSLSDRVKDMLRLGELVDIHVKVLSRKLDD